MFTCPNPSCKKNFEKPLKTLNLQENPTEPYDACPFCLTKIDTTRISKISKVQEDTPLKITPTEESQAQNKENPEKATKPPTCKHHLGYLSERTGKSEIPDDCLTCKSILDCMLKKMR